MNLRALATRIPIALAWLAALYVAAHTTTWIWRLWDPVVFWDSWAFVDHLIDWQRGDYELERLWEQHNEHRILFPRLLFFADFLLCGGRQTLEAVYMLANQLALVLLLAHGARGILAPRPRLAFVAFATAAMFSGATMENLIWAFQVQFVGVLLAGAGAFALFVGAGHGRLRFVAALACMFVASFTMSNGLLVWPIALLLAFALRLPRAFVVELALLGVAVFALYLSDYRPPQQHASPLESLLRPGPLLAYLVTYLGNPLRAFGVTGAQAFGAVGLGVYAWLLWRAVRGWRAVTPAGWFFHAVAAFTAGSGLMTALGRVTFPLTQALTSRYASVALLFWVAITALFAAELARRSRAGPLLATLLCCVAVLPLALRQKLFVHEIFGIHDRIDRGALALAVAPDVPELHVDALYPEPETIRDDIALLRDRRWSAFAEGWHELPGRAFAAQYPRLGEPVPGGVFWAEQRGARGERLLLRGWSAAPAGDPRRLRRFVVTDAGGVIVGLGRGGYGYPLGLGRVMPSGIGKAAEWQAIAQTGGAGPQRLRVYAVDGTGGEARPVGAAIEVAPYVSLSAERIGAALPLARAPRVTGRFVRESAPAGSPPPPAAWDWWGSWVAADADRGRIELGPFPVPATGELVVPYITGPSSFGLSLTLVDAGGGAPVAAAPALAPRPSEWRAWHVAIPPGGSGALLLVAEDAGPHWGQWLAVGVPCELRPAPPGPAGR